MKQDSTIVNRAAVRQGLADSQKAPTLPTTFTRLLKINGDPRTTFAEVVEVITRIALNVGYFDLFSVKDRGLSADLLQNIWLHSTAVALMSLRITRGGRFEFEKEAYVCGLLHDLGKLFFATSYSAPYRALRARVVAGQGTVLAMETDLFGITHVEAAEILGKRWRLPPTIVEVSL